MSLAKPLSAMKWPSLVTLALAALLSNPLWAVPAENEDAPPAASEAAATPAEAPAAKTPARETRSGKTSKQLADPEATAAVQDLLLSAMGLIGVRYKYGGNTPESGLDCSGFIRYVFQTTVNISLPRTAFSMAQLGQPTEKSELKPGDLVFFNTLGRQFSHVGIYLGDNRFIHSPRTGRSVEIVDMRDRYWTSRWNGARRMHGLNGEEIDTSQLLVAAKGARPPYQRARDAEGASDERRCRKVVSGKGRKAKSHTLCSPAPSASGKVVGKHAGKYRKATPVKAHKAAPKKPAHGRKR